MSTKKIPEYNFGDQKEIMKRPLCMRSEKELIEDSKFSIVLGIFDHFLRGHFHRYRLPVFDDF